jgi:hypothetical protein
MGLLYQALLVVPAITHFFNKRASRILHALIGMLLIALGITGVYTLQLPQYLVIVASLILLVDPANEAQVLSLVALIGTLPLGMDLTLIALTLLLVSFSSVKGSQGRIGLYAMAALLLTISLKLLGQNYAATPLILLLVGAVPFQKVLPDLYTSHKSAGILVSLVAVTQLSTNQVEYTSIVPLLLLLGTMTVILGVFQCMTCKRFTDLFSSVHQVAFGLLLASASTSQLNALFYYLLLPCVLSLMMISQIHGGLSEKAEGMFEFGGLSSVIWVESVSTLVTYLVLFSLVSMSAEIFMQIGVGGATLFVVLGCAMIFAAAATLAASFRSYTLVFEGPSRGGAASLGTMKYAIALTSAVNVIIALAPALLLSTFSFVTGIEFPNLGIFNNILLLLLVAALLSALTMARGKQAKKKSWTMGYASVEDTQGSHGEIFTSWREIFKPIYDIDIPDEETTKALEKINPLVLVAVLTILAILGVML